MANVLHLTPGGFERQREALEIASKGLTFSTEGETYEVRVYVDLVDEAGVYNARNMVAYAVAPDDREGFPATYRVLRLGLWRSTPPTADEWAAVRLPDEILSSRDATTGERVEPDAPSSDSTPEESAVALLRQALARYNLSILKEWVQEVVEGGEHSYPYSLVLTHPDKDPTNDDLAGAWATARLAATLVAWRKERHDLL